MLQEPSRRASSRRAPLRDSAAPVSRPVGDHGLLHRRIRRLDQPRVPRLGRPPGADRPCQGSRPGAAAWAPLE
eukprot:6167941-Lingulodinium_polyedra.AAC.1